MKMTQVTEWNEYIQKRNCYDICIGPLMVKVRLLTTVLVLGITKERQSGYLVE